MAVDFQAACLDTTASHSGVSFADCLAALTTITNGYLGYTATLSQLPCAHNANLVVVFFIADEAELTGNAATVNEVNYLDDTNVLCRHRWPTLALFEARGGHDILGLSQRSTNAPGVAGRSAFYVGRKTRTGAGDPDGWGTGDGLTYRDRFDGPGDSAIGATWQAGNSYTWCGPIVRERIFTPTSPHAAENMKPYPEGDFSANPLVFYMDHRYAPGQFGCGLMSHSHNTQAWTQDGLEPDIWSKPGGAYATYVWGMCLDPVKSTSGLFSQNFLLAVDSEAECRATPWSWYKESDSIDAVTWVNIPGGEDPRFRVGWTGFGTDPGYNMADALLGGATLRSRGIKHINCQIINMGSIGQGNTYFPQSEWLGGRYLARSSFKPQTVVPGTKWGWSEDGEILFDTSDRPDADTDEYLVELIGQHGSDYATWKSAMPRFIQIKAAPEGIYEFAGGFTDKAGFTVQGLLSDDIGDWEDSARNMAGVGWTHYDAHHIGQQGVSNLNASFFYCRRETPNHDVKGIVENYIVNDVANCQNLRDCAFTDFVVAGGAFGFVRPGGYERLTVNGFITGNALRRFVIADNPLPSDPTYFNGVPAGGIGLSTTFNAVVTLRDGTFLRVANCIDGQYNTDLVSDTAEGQNPARGLLGGIGIDADGIRYVDWESRVYHMRQTGWHQALKSVSGIAKGAQTVVTVTGHGFPDVDSGTVYVKPEIYFENIVGPTLLNGNLYRIDVIDADSFYLQDANGGDIDSSGWPDFVSGGCARGCIGGIRTQNSTFVKAGVDADTTVFKYANGNYSLNQLQAFAGAQQALPGMADALYESGSVINP
jgi:hypothetical protein